MSNRVLAQQKTKQTADRNINKQSTEIQTSSGQKYKQTVDRNTIKLPTEIKIDKQALGRPVNFDTFLFL